MKNMRISYIFLNVVCEVNLRVGYDLAGIDMTAFCIAHIAHLPGAEFVGFTLD